MGITGVQSSLWGKYIPAELTVRLHEPELETDWTSVYDDLGLKRPNSLVKELSQQAQVKSMELIEAKAREGDRIANLAAKEKNVFGKVAHERYMQNGRKEITVEAIPKQGVYIDFRIYPPEIHFEVKGALPR